MLLKDTELFNEVNLTGLNSSIDLQTLTYKSGQKIWWDCLDHPHAFLTTPQKRSNGYGCNYCSGHKVLVGFNDVYSQKPSLAALWKDSLDPKKVYFNSYKKYTVKCSHDNCEETKLISPKFFTEGLSKIECMIHSKVIVKSVDSEIFSEEWEDKENPCNVSAYSSMPYNWKCSEGHVYKMSPKNRHYGKGCPVCAGRKVISGVNDIRSKYPFIENFWDDPRDPSTVYFSSSKPVKLMCKEHGGYKWDMYPESIRKHGIIRCPVSLGKVVLDGINDLVTTHPKLKNQWHKDNPPMNTFSSGSKFIAKWECDFGHVWSLKINDRTRERYGNNEYSGCPYCKISNFQRSVLDFIKSNYNGKIKEMDRTLIKPYELDILIPDRKIAFECNGTYWHTESKTGAKKHMKKTEMCKEKGWHLIHVWEDDWVYKRNNMEDIILDALGCQKREKIDAIKMSMKTICKEDAFNFLDDNHIQGKSSGSYYLAGFYRDRVVSVSVWGKRKNEWELVKYASSIDVKEGVEKHVSYFDRKYNSKGYDIISFCDLQYFSGDIYKNAGFNEEKILLPNYFYFHKGRRISRTDFKREVLKSSHLDNTEKIWDAGKIKYRRSSINIKTQSLTNQTQR